MLSKRIQFGTGDDPGENTGWFGGGPRTGEVRRTAAGAYE